MQNPRRRPPRKHPVRADQSCRPTGLRRLRTTLPLLIRNIPHQSPLSGKMRRRRNNLPLLLPIRFRLFKPGAKTRCRAPTGIGKAKANSSGQGATADEASGEGAAAIEAGRTNRSNGSQSPLNCERRIAALSAQSAMPSEDRQTAAHPERGSGGSNPGGSRARGRRVEASGAAAFRPVRRLFRSPGGRGRLSEPD